MWHCRLTAALAGAQTNGLSHPPPVSNHSNNGLVYPLHLPISLGMIRRGTELLHTIQLRGLHDLAHEGFPLITDEVGRHPKQSEVTMPQGMGGGCSCLIFDYISQHILREMILNHQNVADSWGLL